MATSHVRFDAAGGYEVEESDVAFARPQGLELLARIYRPKGTPAAPLGAIVDVHGGAWNRGDRTVGALHGRALAASGLVVASLDFRQGPEHQHPASCADIAAGIRWVRAHAGRLGVDPRRIALTGSSSGGQLALLVAIKPDVPAHGTTPFLRPDGSLETAGDASVAAVVALYPVADPLARYRYVQTREHEPVPESGFDAKRLLASHRAYFTGEAAMAEASVTRSIEAREASALPPAFVAQAGLDDNVPGAIVEALVDAYRKAGGTLEHEHFPTARHGFLGRASEDADRCVALMRGFFGRHLAG